MPAVLEIALPLQIAIYLSEDDEGGKFTAHCLSMDLVADDDSIPGAVSKLLGTIEVAIEAAGKHDANVFRKAPRKYWRMATGMDKPPRSVRRCNV